MTTKQLAELRTLASDLHVWWEHNRRITREISGTQARYVELHRLANHEAAAFIRHYEAREHA